jgi:hypothetical protein
VLVLFCVIASEATQSGAGNAQSTEIASSPAPRNDGGGGGTKPPRVHTARGDLKPILSIRPQQNSAVYTVHSAAIKYGLMAAFTLLLASQLVSTF